MQTLVHDGREYTRFDAQSFWASVDSSLEYPNVMCSCGNTTFSLHYEAYELFARCVKCNALDSVYSG